MGRNITPHSSPTGTGLAHLAGLGPLARHCRPTQSPSGLLAISRHMGRGGAREGECSDLQRVNPRPRASVSPVLRAANACRQLSLKRTVVPGLGSPADPPNAAGDPGSSVHEPPPELATSTREESRSAEPPPGPALGPAMWPAGRALPGQAGVPCAGSMGRSPALHPHRGGSARSAAPGPFPAE